MGITMYCAGHRAYDLGYGGFMRLRVTVSRLCKKDIAKLYEFQAQHASWFSDDERWAECDNVFKKLCSKYKKKKYANALLFLYVPDTDARLSYKVANDLLKIIGNYDDHEIYGYAGQEDPFMFKDFKAILRYAAENKKKWGWE